MATRTVTISVIGVSGKESVKGLKGVGKSLLCNRFVRGNYDDFFPDHCSVLSQTDFGGSPVINNDHWLYWGERLIEYDESGARVNLRVIEQTEFLDDETYEPIAGPSTSENYSKRSCRTKLESRDKLIQCNSASVILSNAIKSKKPVVLALSQCDIMDEEARKSLQILLNKKDLKSSHITVIEVSSVMNVNIDELFIIAANSSLKGKTRLKVLPYLEAVKFTNERNRNAKLLSDRALDRQPDYCTFVKIFGSAAARKAYDQHVNEAREHWMAARLRALLPNLPRVFAALLDKSDIANLSWHEANQRVHSHALFDEFFQPLGVLGGFFKSKQLDPVSPYGYQEKFRENTIIDHRIPAEILLRHEARQAFEAYQQAVEAEHRKERLEEDFEFLLAETAQVTPGKPLQDVCIFLQGYCAYEALPPSQASLVYDRFQHELVKKAEIEFSECLLEHIEIFADLARTWKKDNYYERNYNLSERDLEGIKEYLQDDYRFRHLSRLFELRDKMIHQFATFVANPQIRDCPAMQRCIDVSLHEITSQFFQRFRMLIKSNQSVSPVFRKRMNSHSLAHIVDIVVHGEISMVAQFITEIKTSILCGDPYSIECLLGSMFSGDPEVLRAVINPNLLGSGIIPLDTCSTSSSRYIRVDLKLGSYHSWLTARSTSPTHGHIETNLLLTEGNELATSIGATFITLSPDSATNTSQSVEFVKFFDRLQGMVPLFKPNSLERIKRNSDGYAVLKEFKSGQQKVDGNLYITHKTSCSAGTLLSESSNSRESTLSTGVARSPRTESAISTPILRSSASAITLCNSSVSTRPRRRAAPGKIPLRLPLMKEPIPAPLATPEMVEFAPEYSIVQDALTDDDHIYATLDFASATKDDQKSVTSSEKSNSSGKKDKKRPLRSRMFSNHSNSTEPSSSPSVSAPSGSQPSSAGSSVRDNVSVVQVGDVISTTFTHHSSSSPLLNSQTTINSNAASTLFIPPVTPIRPKIAPKPMHLIANLHAKPTRSKTMDIISKDAIVKGQQLADNGLKKSSSIKMVGLRQSLSAESFAELIAEKKKKREFGGSKFVRKVATSFRFKKIPPTPISEKNTPSFEDVPKNSLVISLPIKGSRSLPQSPQIERKNGQKKITSMASSEKASTTFFWLPSRSPKRAHKTLNDTLQGVIGLNDTIESLSEKAGGLPLFLTRCIDFIEKEGGLEMEGLYRVPGNQAQLTELEKTFKEKGDIDLVRLQMPVHVVATAVKNFFSCLPEPLVPTELHEEILESVEKNEVAASPHTAMDVKNLSKVWFPTLFRPQFDDFDAMSCGMTKFQQATEAILKNCNEIFHIPKTE
uniref:Rho GTPase-activating protein 190 n=1 Tax=Heterorhabditis bacteriophora TaxID=37862 RepID=A0A1I7XKB3_HETBA